MLNYATIGTNNLERAATFYDPIATILGSGRVMESERYIIWGELGVGMLGLMEPANGEPATPGNGVMVGLVATNEQQVHDIYDHALAHGGADEGAPGPRGDNFYGAYFRDPDGNKVLVSMTRES